MPRPVGVTVMAVLNFIFGGLTVIIGLLFILLGATGAAAGAMGGTGWGAILLGLGAVAGVFCLVMGALGFAVGIGLMRLRNWARMVTIVLAGISVAMTGMGMLASMATFEPFSFVFQGMFTAVYVWMIWYLLQPRVKQAFGVA